MSRFLVRRALTAVLVLLGTTVVTFILARVVPSDPAVAYIGVKARPEDLVRVRHQLGLDQPLPVQYARYVKGLVTGDWGNSIASKQPVLGEILHRLPATLELVIVAMLIAFVIGVALGVIAAARQNRLTDHLVRLLSIGGVSMPAFWLGLLMQVVFFGKLNLFPPAGDIDPDLEFTNPLHQITGIHVLDALFTGNTVALQSAASHLVLPALTLAAYPTGVIARMTRASMIEALNQDYVRAARAYGIAERTVRWRIALRNALPPTMTVVGLTLAYALTGAFFVEVVFNWPGLGQYAANALLAVDYPAIMGVTVLAATAYVLVNLAVDVAHARLDPRVRLA